MKQNMRKWAELSRKGAALLLALVMVMGFFMPVHATGDITEPTEPETTAVTEPETTAAATEPETTVVTEPETTAAATEAAPAETTVPADEPQITETVPVKVEQTNVSKDAAAAVVEKTPFEKALDEMTALEEEVKTLEATEEVLDEFYGRLRMTYSNAFDLYDTNVISGEQWDEIDAKFINILTCLETTYGYKNGNIQKRANGDTVPVRVPDADVASINATVKIFNYDKTVNNNAIKNLTYPSGDYFDTTDGIFRFESGTTFYDKDTANEDTYINKAHDLKENHTFPYGSQNWYEVDKVLADNKYPQLVVDPKNPYNVAYDLGLSGTHGSLEYLFKEGTTFHKGTMSDGGGLFQLTADGYYEYDSAKNSAYFNGTKFELYDAPVYPTYLYFAQDVINSDNVSNEKQYGTFLPFNNPSIVYDTSIAEDNQMVQLYDLNKKLKADDGIERTYYALHYGRPYLTGPKNIADMWFGMTVEFDFYIPQDSIWNDEDMVFQFDGDDDVMVYIDGVLVLDLSGIHVPEDGEINFTDGTVSDMASRYAGGSTTIRDRFEESGKYTTAQLNAMFNADGTFKDFSEHNLKFFFLERGSGISYCHLKFNLPTLPTSGLSVSKAVRNDPGTDDEFTFDLVLKERAGGNPLSSVKWTKGSSSGTYANAEGKYTFTLKDTEIITFDLPINTYYEVSERTKTNYITTHTENNIGSMANEAILVAYTNRYDSSAVNVRKVVDGANPDTNKEFTFTATLQGGGKFSEDALFISVDGTQVSLNGKTSYSFKLKHNQVVTFSELPVGTVLIITEDDYSGDNYTTKNNTANSRIATYTVKKSGNTEILFTNTKQQELGDVKVSKTVVGGVSVDTGKAFTFTATLQDGSAFPSGVTLEGAASNTGAVSGTSWTFTLKHGQTATFKNLHKGSVLVVKETKADYYTTKVGNTVTDTGTGTAAAAAPTIAFTNTLEPGSVKVTKTVAGGLNTDTTTEFTFTATLKNGNNSIDFPADATIKIDTGSTTTSGKTGSTWSFKLKGGQTASFSGLPVGATLEVEETAATNYTTTVTNNGKATVVNGSTPVIAFTNTKAPGTVTVTKTVSGTTTTEAFQFTAQLLNGNTAINFPEGAKYTPDGGSAVSLAGQGSYTFTLQHGKTGTFTGLPDGAKLRITESDYANYTTTIGTETVKTIDASVAMGRTTAVTFTNTLKTGSVKITKAVVGSDTTKAFAFNATRADGEAFPANPGTGITLKDDGMTASFTLKDGESVIFENLPVGTVLNVTEEADDNYTTTNDSATPNGVSGTVTVGVDSVAELIYTNTQKPASVTIQKTVSGNMGNKDEAFSFTVTMKDAQGNDLFFTYNGASVKTATFSLKHGDKKELTNVPVGAIVTVTETTNGYTATAKVNGVKYDVVDGKVTFTASAVAQYDLVVNNDKGETISTGIMLDSLPYILILAVVIVGGAFLFLRKRKSQED